MHNCNNNFYVSEEGGIFCKSIAQFSEFRLSLSSDLLQISIYEARRIIEIQQREGLVQFIVTAEIRIYLLK